VNKPHCENVLGYPITIQDMQACVEQILAWIASSEKGKYLVCANPHSLEIARSDSLFSKGILGADLVTPDGIGMVLASRILGGSTHDRITGSDIFSGVSSALNQQGGSRYFFLGSTEETLARIQHNLKRDFPNIDLAGTYSPSFNREFSLEENDAMIDAVNRAAPDVLWVGMTAPKQEKWVYQHKDALNVSFIGAVGAAFDFYAGTVKRSHPWFQEHGFEWLPRWLHEPRRLWYRNFVSFPRFLMRVMLQRLFKSKGPRELE
jgi:N-acetylglucosaminyldiphosphoundecaprenol N-acetyl-beta-D-mannosaminyltransferase